MKKLTLILLTIVIGVMSVFGLTACNNDDTIVVYTEAGFAPFEYISGGQIVGVDVDIMNLVGEKLGKKVVFENVNFDIIIDAVSAGKLCNVGAAGISITEERAQYVEFSNEYYSAALYVIYKVDLASSYESETTDNTVGIYWDSLAGKKIAVQTGTTADLFLGDELDEGGILNGTGASVVQCSALSTAVANIGSGDADVLIIDQLPAQELIKNDPSLKCSPLYYQGAEGENDEAAIDTYAICVTKGQTELLVAINEVLAELGKNGIDLLVKKHLGIEG
ncbi:MAG: transporter substrate-binding domain-containing protein [Clostridiales bacterium]|nr:transporter substrate-binding domain-containing protein [Clostridiales bacterium]